MPGEHPLTVDARGAGRMTGPPLLCVADYLRKSGTSRSSFSSKVTVRGGGGCCARTGSTWASRCSVTDGVVAGRSDRLGPLRPAPAGVAGRTAGAGAAAAGAGADRPWTVPSARSSAAVQRRPAVEPGRDDGDPHLVAERVVDDRAEDDVGLGVRGLLDQAGRLVDLEQAEVGAALDGEQHAVGAVDAGLEQRAGDRELGGLDGAVLAAGRADAHERGARRPA